MDKQTRRGFFKSVVAVAGAAVVAPYVQQAAPTVQPIEVCIDGKEIGRIVAESIQHRSDRMMIDLFETTSWHDNYSTFTRGLNDSHL